MSHEIVGRTRALIQYHPYHFINNEWQNTPHPVWREMIRQEGGWMLWTGDYRSNSSETIKDDEVLQISILPD